MAVAARMAVARRTGWENCPTNLARPQSGAAVDSPNPRSHAIFHFRFCALGNISLVMGHSPCCRRGPAVTLRDASEQPPAAHRIGDTP